MMVALWRDYEFILLKFDGVVGPLRPEKQDAFVRMMTECRKHSPDLILLNHRLNSMTGTFLRQLFFHEFEAAAHAAAERGER